MSSLWERVRSGGKTGFDKAWKAADKLGAPVNRWSNKLGSEAFWPTTLDKESDKAARILKSFCKDGFFAEQERQATDGPKQRQKVLKKIPTSVIKNAKGLAIFTTLRTGLWMSGAGGSGILIAKQEDGSWSPPSGILLHTAGLGFMVGVDIYDCVVVINTEQALEAFYKVRCTLGSEVSVSAGPLGAGGVLDTEVHKRQAPIFTYMKSRGFYAGVQIDGTIVIERTDENERFYNTRIPVRDILAGKVRHPPAEIKSLLETIKAAQGDSDFDESVLPSEPPPSDFEVDDGHIFGLPDKEDPDPYGVLALEKEGMGVVEAGTKKQASWEEFSFNPSPTSPAREMYGRKSLDRERTMSTRSSWRGSMASTVGHNTNHVRPSSLRHSLEHPVKHSAMVDSSTQTDIAPEPQSPSISGWRNGVSRDSSRASISNSLHQQMQDVPENSTLETAPIHKENTNPTEINGYTTPPSTPPSETPDRIELKDTEHEEVEIVQPVIQSVQAVKPVSTQMITKAKLVTVPKRIPPKLPPRNPGRTTANDSASIKSSDEQILTSPRNSEAFSDRSSSSKRNSETIEATQVQLDNVQINDEEEPKSAQRHSNLSTRANVQDVRQEDQDAPAMPGMF